MGVRYKGRVKPRHAVALALVGWYLMMPPLDDAQNPAGGAPLSMWVQSRSFDGADDCEVTRSAVRQRVASLTPEQQRQMEREVTAEYGHGPHGTFAQLRARVELEKCIAADDPRLKGVDHRLLVNPFGFGHVGQALAGL